MNTRLKILLTSFAVLATSCASTMPLDGGRFDDHASTLVKCGVGNYVFQMDVSCHSATAEAAAPVEARSVAVPTFEKMNEKSLKANTATPTKTAKLVDHKIMISKQITFRTGSAQLAEQGKKILDDVATVITDHSGKILKVKIEGHTDAVGDADQNQSLSLARAESVKDYLSKKGIDGAKLEPKGYGMTSPKFDPATATKAQLAQNRRVEFFVEML